jgi:hypothetical protein
MGISFQNYSEKSWYYTINFSDVFLYSDQMARKNIWPTYDSLEAITDAGIFVE